MTYDLDTIDLDNCKIKDTNIYAIVHVWKFQNFSHSPMMAQTDKV